MGGHQHRPPVATLPGQEAVQESQRLLVQPGLRLVQQQNWGVMENGPGQGEPLLHPVGEGAYPLVEVSLEAHLPGDPVDPRLQLINTKHPAIEAQVLGAGQVIVEQGLVGHHADVSSNSGRISTQLSPGDVNPAAVRSGQGSQRPDQGGLTGAVGAEEYQELTPCYLKVQVVQHRYPTERLDQPLHGNGRSLFRRRVHVCSFLALCGYGRKEGHNPSLS